jgi:hypothetical protein
MLASAQTDLVALVDDIDRLDRAAGSSRPRVPVVFTNDGRARLVVRRDSWDDLLVRDVD